jgi:hypothetical protein
MWSSHLRRLLITIVITAIAPALQPWAGNVESFVLDSTPSTYPFSLRIEGTLERTADKLLVTVRGGEIRSAIPLDLKEEGEATEVRIALGLGGTVEGGWRMGYETPDQVVAPKLSPGETIPIPQLTFVVSGIDRAPLADQWLTARLGVMQHLPGVQKGLLWSYACSEQNILGPTAASRERAKLMKTSYSHTC